MIEIKNKTELRRYKNIPGIYMFVNILNDKKYIGQSVDLYSRISYHISCIKRRCFAIKALYKAVLKYGIDNFKIYILTTFPRHQNLRKNLNLAEQIYIQFYNTYKNGYNCTLGGDGGVLGYRWSDERRSSWSEYMKRNNKLDHDSCKKKVYLYNFVENYYVEYNSVIEASEHLSKSENNIYPICISQNAQGKTHRVGDFIAAYDKDKLEAKIKEFSDFISKNKYKSIRPNYDKYFNWLVTIADDNGLIPPAKEISTMLNINMCSIQNWNRQLGNRLENIRIGTKDRKRIVNYEQYKGKKTQ